MSELLSSARLEFARLKKLAEGALAQVARDEDLHRALDAEANSLAVIVRHVAGNLRSRWTDFLTSDGEKPDRDREAEFDSTIRPGRAALLEEWNAAWDVLFATFDGLRAEDVSRRVRIRGEELTVTEAVHRQLTHYAYHVGQIVFLARHFVGPGWTSLSIPRGGSRGAKGGYKKP